MLSQAITITVIVLALARFWLLRIGAIALRGLGQAVIAAFYADPNLTPADWRIERKSFAPVMFCLDDRWGGGILTRQPGGIERPPLPRTCPIRNTRYIQRKPRGLAHLMARPTRHIPVGERLTRLTFSTARSCG